VIGTVVGALLFAVVFILAVRQAGRRR